MLELAVNVVRGQMKFSLPSFSVKPSQRVKITFTNPDEMQHNLVVVKPGTVDAVGALADALAKTPDAAERNYIPPTPDVVVNTKLVDPQQTFTLEFVAPQAERRLPVHLHLPRPLARDAGRDEGGAVTIRVAVVGLGFGAEFLPIYQRHPDTELYAICQRNTDKLKEVGDQFGIERRFDSYEKLLADPKVDAVHINTPIAAHAPMSLAGLNAGKHVACTVPMATTVDECVKLVEAERRNGKVYMMMETAVYTREFLFASRAAHVGQARQAPVPARVAPAEHEPSRAGPSTGTACRRCTTRRTPSDRCSRSRARARSRWSASARDGSATST